MLAFRSLHNIDLATNLVASKAIPDDFSAFIDDYLSFAKSNGNTKNYTIKDETTQVIACISRIVSIALANAKSAEVAAEMSEKANSIAKRLFYSEHDAQEKISQMNKFIKKGSLVQALIPGEADTYLYIIAKVEHSEWFDGESLKKSFGFTSEKKNVWKSAVIPVYLSEGDICFGSIRVYTDNEASYWSKDFLELVEEKSDEFNTKTAFVAMDTELKKSLKKNYPRDYYILRNSIIQAMKTPQLLNYIEYIEKLLGGYVPEEQGVNTAYLKERLLALPGKKKFDTQFTTVPTAITAKKKSKFDINEGITLNIDGYIEDYKEVIKAGTDENHNRIVMIRCTDNDTYKAFGGQSV